MRKKIVLLLVMLLLIVGCNKKEGSNSKYSNLNGTYINDDSQSSFIFDKSDIGTMTLYEEKETFTITYENDTKFLINDGEDGYLIFSSDFNSFEWRSDNATYSLSYVKE